MLYTSLEQLFVKNSVVYNLKSMKSLAPWPSEVFLIPDFKSVTPDKIKM